MQRDARKASGALGSPSAISPLLDLVRLLARQAAREFILQQQTTDGSLNEPPVEDA